MMASRGMGAVAPSKMPKGETKARRDNTDFTQYAEGGTVATKDKWIQGAIKKPGALKKQLGISAKKAIPPKILAKAAKAPGKLGQRARLAKTLKGM